MSGIDWERVIAERPERLSCEDVRATPAGGLWGHWHPHGRVLSVIVDRGPRYHLVAEGDGLVYLREDLLADR